MTGRSVLAVMLIMIQGTAAADCFDSAGTRYEVSPDLLRAIATVESAGNPKAINRNEDGSEDLCAMQINSQHLPFLSAHGITRAVLLSDECTCVAVGAYFLASEIAQAGRTWEAVGRYHTGPAGSMTRKAAYAEKVKRAYDRLNRLKTAANN